MFPKKIFIIKNMRILQSFISIIALCIIFNVVSSEETAKTITKNLRISYTKGQSDVYKLRTNDLLLNNIILLCDTENTMKIVYEDDERIYEEKTRIFLANNTKYEYTIHLLNKASNFTFEAAYFPNLINITYVKFNFSLEFNKYYSPTDNIVIIVDYKNYNSKSPAILHYEQYIGNLDVKYIPITQSLIFSSVISKDKFSGVKQVNNFIRVNARYFIIKIKTNSAYNFKIKLSDYFVPNNYEQNIYALHQEYYLMEPNTKILLSSDYSLAKSNGIFFKILGYEKNNFKLSVLSDENYSYLNITSKGFLVYYRNYLKKVEVTAENGFILFSVKSRASNYKAYTNDYRSLLDRKLLVFQAPENNYDVLFFKIKVKSTDRKIDETCNKYSIGGGLILDDFVNIDGPTYRLENRYDLYSNYYYANYYLYNNTQRFIQEKFFAGAYYYCKYDWEVAYDSYFSFEFKNIFWNDISILENNKSHLININDYEETKIDKLKEFYKILIPDNQKKLRFTISNYYTGYINFHISKSINQTLKSFMTISGEYSNFVDLPAKDDPYLKKRYFYIYFENAKLLSFNFDFVTFASDYKIQYTNLNKNINVTQNENLNNKVNISFYPYLYDEKVEYNLIIFNGTVKEAITKKVQFDYVSSQFEYKEVKLGTILVKSPNANAINKQFTFPYTYTNFFTVVLISKQIENYKYSQLYSKNLFKFKYKVKN